mmetsp:Transcript_6809/g.9940  ORF Transcript_6809/g.9940 Transcript_6809/m.9940 type:complete len:171 (+) Transcript_6809:35-547(+)|eukprot:CAMPEP_0194200740 /NCGR_PEP_ID=MMETSP0156-20130528/1222_1 /TAXON_ID=33649 /ORGANISM="Thalassionema nitzschioides, Strain L26-B" /LENGTH=170 /DNA_ID=CAMNT_0038925781 /DNA_START=26 /DNA_END=538 /DNA_ORIENTATION=-
MALEKSIENVVSSWKNVKSIDNYEEVAGVILFRKIFKIAPDASALFRFAQGVEKDENGELPEAIFESFHLKSHAKGVIQTVDAAVGLLEKDEIPQLVEVLRELGRRHNKYGVRFPHFEVVGSALVQTLKIALGEFAFTDDVEAAWLEIFGIIQKEMMVGIVGGMTYECDC